MTLNPEPNEFGSAINQHATITLDDYRTFRGQISDVRIEKADTFGGRYAVTATMLIFQAPPMASSSNKEHGMARSVATECGTCGRDIGLWAPPDLQSGYTHMREDGAADFDANANHDVVPTDFAPFPPSWDLPETQATMGA